MVHQDDRRPFPNTGEEEIASRAFICWQWKLTVAGFVMA
jgi:hypothetical protein